MAVENTICIAHPLLSSERSVCNILGGIWSLFFRGAAYIGRYIAGARAPSTVQIFV